MPKEKSCLTCNHATVNQGCHGCTQESKWQPKEPQQEHPDCRKCSLAGNDFACTFCDGRIPKEVLEHKAEEVQD